MNAVGKLVLGTAQFGMDYGINNVRGQVTPDEVNEILSAAGNAGVEFIDTAYGYGNSEDVLGDSSSLHNHPFRPKSKAEIEVFEKLKTLSEIQGRCGLPFAF